MTSPQEELIKRLKAWAESGHNIRTELRVDILDAIAEIQRQDRHLQRLGDETLFLPLIKVMPSLGPQVNWVKEHDARIAYARANRCEDEK